MAHCYPRGRMGKGLKEMPSAGARWAQIQKIIHSPRDLLAPTVEPGEPPCRKSGLSGFIIETVAADVLK